MHMRGVTIDELLKDSVTSWEELTEAFYEIFSDHFKMVNLRKGINNLKWIDGELLHETYMVTILKVIVTMS